jgi:uncharacterized protein (TIGR00255 family)
MTGFSRTTGQLERHRWTWEAKSVNGRSLDVRLKTPYGFDRIELPIKKLTTERLGRGSVSLSLTIESELTASTLQVNRRLLDDLITLHEELAGRVAIDLPKIETLLTVKGVIEAAETAETEDYTEQQELAIMQSLTEVLDGLIASRSAEGKRLHALIEDYVSNLENLCRDARNSDGTRVSDIRDRLQRQIDELMETSNSIDEKRLTQEVAILATKADVREEIDRLEAHCAASRDLLAASGPAGRRLDFLCQELNREANTLCSKSASEELTQIGLEMKAVIDQFREQAQNVE